MYLPWRTPEYGPPLWTSLTAAEASFLRGQATDRDVLEVGAAYGYSTILMAEVAASVVSVDPHDALDSLPILRDNLKQYGCEGNVDVRAGRSQDVLPTLLARHFGLVFIDGDHAYEAVKFDCEWARKLAKPFGAVIAFHDYGEDSCPGVRQALDEWQPPVILIDTLAVYSDPRFPVSA